jgi:hypothetical protein
VLAYERGLVLLQDYTTDRNLLLSRLKSYTPWAMHFPLETHPDKPSAVPGPKRRDPNVVPSRETAQLAEDASRDTRMTLQALAEHLALVPGRKNVFLLRGQGPPLLMHGMNGMAWDKTVDALNEANVAVNTVGELALRTGGQTWHETFDLDTILANQIEASRTAYTLGFYLTEKERDNEFHAVTVAVDRLGVRLFYRQGFYAGSTELPAASWQKSDKGEMESALLNRVDSTGIGITARVDAVAGTIHLSLDPAGLSLTAEGSGWTGKVEEMFVEQNANGNTLSKISDTKTFGVSAAQRAVFDSNGVAWSISIPFVEGATKIVMVVRDSKTGRVGSLSVPLM